MRHDKYDLKYENGKFITTNSRLLTEVVLDAESAVELAGWDAVTITDLAAKKIKDYLKECNTEKAIDWFDLQKEKLK